MRAWLLAMLLLGGCRHDQGPHPPAVALITIDTWRLDHFDATYTPHLWRLAEQGERWDNAWSAIGLTTPSHVTLFTGLMPWEHGVEGNNHHGYSLSATIPVLPETLPVRLATDRWPASSWVKAAFTSAYPAGPAGGLGRGWDVFNGPDAGERPGSQTVALALDWLGRVTRNPVLLWVHLYEPHGPYQGAEPGSGREKQAYGDEVRRADAALAPLLDALEARRARIVVAADHGEVLDEETCHWQHGRSSSDEVLRVPLMRWEPGALPSAHHERVGLVDVPALLAGDAPRARSIWLAESGICEPGCTPGCTPAGLAGRDRVVVGDGGRWTLRGGRLLQQGHPDRAWLPALRAIPPVPPAAALATPEMTSALGYQ